MAYEHLRVGTLDYFPCRYGASKLLFRGPRQKLDKPYCAVLGGSETYGKFVPEPYPALAQQVSGRRMINLGCVNAGVDVFLGDPSILDICTQSQVTVMQVLGAQNMSNRFYSVHPRRNDRFVRASTILKAIYREVDFTEFNFTRHMLATLQMISPEKFAVVEEELQAAWVARMKSLLQRIGGRTILLWLADHAPGAGLCDEDGLGPDPLMVTREMVDEVREGASEYIEIVTERSGPQNNCEGMVFAPLEEAAAAEMPGPLVHARVARILARAVDKYF